MLEEEEEEEESGRCKMEERKRWRMANRITVRADPINLQLRKAEKNPLKYYKKS